LFTEKKNHIWIFTVLFFTFLPYSFPSSYLSSDLMPWATLVALIFLLLRPSAIIFLNMFSYPYLIILIIAFIGILFAPQVYDLEVMRAFFPYLSLFILISFYSYVFKTEKDLVFSKKIISLLVLFIFVVAFSQMLFDKHLFGSLVGGLRTSHERGVAGLFKEPSMFSATLIFIVLIADLIYSKRRSNLIFYLSIGVVFLGIKSVVGYIYFLINIFFRILFKRPMLMFILFIIFVALSFFAFSYDIEYIPGWRISKILKIINENHLVGLLSLDASTHDRFSQIYFSILGFYENYGLPHFYLEWQNYLTNTIDKYNWVRNEVVWLSKTDRIFSGYGSALFEMGYFGLLMIFYPFFILQKKLKTKKALIHFFTLTLLMFSSIPLSFPLYALYLSIVINLKRTDDIDNNNDS